jgi:superfamily II DNA or RNA helicase
MTREEVTKRIRESPFANYLLILPTGHGKTYQALTVIDKYILEPKTILIIVPRLVLIDNWKEEFKKFGFSHYLPYVTFTTYNSLHKHVDTKWDITIYDECHHISERCKEIVKTITGEHNVFLSATVKPELQYWINNIYSPEIVKINLRNAIDNEVLPDPKVILIPLHLDNVFATEILKKESKDKKEWITCSYRDRWKYLKNYNCNIKCTPYQYNIEISNDIEYWKKRAMSSKFFKNKWLHLCGERLKWLSRQKDDIILNLLKQLKNYRTLTFCNSIEQTEILGKYCINSKNKQSEEFLNMFNNKKIKHITSVNMLNEGMNLVDCKIGIYACLNSSETLIKQKTGRLLRHKEPIIIIPYYVNTREEELVKQMLENYNPELVSTITKFEDIIL